MTEKQVETSHALIIAPLTLVIEACYLSPMISAAVLALSRVFSITVSDSPPF